MEKYYSSKQSAVRGMWRWYHRNVGGSPLVGDNGTTLQWVSCEALTRRAYVTKSDYYQQYILVTPDNY